MSDEKNELDLNKKPTSEELAGYRFQNMSAIAKLVEPADGLHIYDALHKLGLPRALILCNMGEATVRHWWNLSKDRALVLAVEGGVPDLEVIRDRTAQGMAVAGLGDKLAIMAALADPTTEEGAEMLLKLATLQSKLLPKVSKVTKEDKSEEEKLMREEVKKLRAEREKIERLHDQAQDANFEPNGD